MRFKLFLTLALAGGLLASAQTQGYKDGIEYYKAGQHDNARTILERTITDSNTDKSLANYYLGQVALAQDNKAAAKSYFDKGLELNPENGYNYVGLGALDLLNGQDQAASKRFSEAQKHAKKNVDLIVAIARAYYNADPVKYAKEVQKYIAKAHKDSKYNEPATYILEGDMLMDAQDYGGAAAKYETAIAKDEANSEGYVKYANAYFKVNKDYGIKKLEELLAQQPNSAMAQRELAEKYFLADHWKKASELYGKYIQNPNHFPEDKARYAVLLYWGEKYPESLAVANEILGQDPSNFLMQRVRFLDQTAMKDYAAAADNAAKFFASNPDGNFTTNDYVTYAEALTGVGQDSLAVVQYEIAVDRDPKNGDLLKNLSTVYSQQKDYIKSAESYDAYLKLQENPSLNDLFGMSGRYLNAAVNASDTIQAKELAGRGLDYVGQVIERAQPNPLFFQREGRLYIAANEKKPDAQAIASYDKMLELLDADPENMNPANPNNTLDMYREAYSFEIMYYANFNIDKEKQALFTDKYNTVKELLTPKAQ
ncbi:MAG: tetratricopeptide repeat protein [Muribaculaceae bacterium]|nr:tetratricopeptide repeat protein [Muribaculaceae bacterium]